MKKNLRVLDFKRISKHATHCAFTDLIENPFDKSCKTLMCCYRQATDHVSTDGAVIVLTLDKTSFQVRNRVIIRENNADLRDPKFSYDGSRLLLTTYTKSFPECGKLVTKMVTYFSTTGLSWSAGNSHGSPVGGCGTILSITQKLMVLRTIDKRTQFRSIRVTQHVQCTFTRRRLFVWTNKVKVTPMKAQSCLMITEMPRYF